MIFTDIVVIDSGIEWNNSLIKFQNKPQGINLTGNKSTDNIMDSIGHGTAVYYLINQYSPDADLFVIKIFDNDFATTFDVLYHALLYVLEHISCKIIHMSNGITYCDDLNLLRDLCNKLVNKGITIVAAFDNNGAISYPAAFNNVIGVDFSISNKRISEFEYVENSPINIRGMGTEIIVPWLNSKMKNVGGSSFATPYITSLIFNHMFLTNEYTDVHLLLKDKAKKSILYEHRNQVKFNIKNVKKAIIFPYNKEIHSILRYNDLLPFEIESIYDVKNLGNIGKKISDLQSVNNKNDWVIDNYLNVAWDSNFDTVILGHTEEISGAIEIDLIQFFLDMCGKHKKNIYCFDDLKKYVDHKNEIITNGNFCFYPYVDDTFVNNNTFGKLKHIGKPVIAVVGTGTRQGKFTLQLELRSRLKKHDYNVKQLGTEPSSLLFGFDACLPVGYRSTVSEHGNNLIKITNDIMGQMETEQAEIILVGTQSNTIPLTLGSLGFYPLYNTDILLGSEPDISLLCININDELEYVKRTIAYLESYVLTKVAALIIYPVIRDRLWSSLTSKGTYVNNEKLMAKKNELCEAIGINTYILGDENEMDQLFNYIIDCF